MKCLHKKHSGRFIETEDYFTGEKMGVWERSFEYTTVDIDLHRYKCTQCGEVMYYSDRAREYYEEGKKFEWIKGLDK